MLTGKSRRTSPRDKCGATNSPPASNSALRRSKGSPHARAYPRSGGVGMRTSPKLHRETVTCERNHSLAEIRTGHD